MVCEKKMDPVHSRPRRIRSDRGLPQRGGLFPFWKLMRRPPQQQRLPSRRRRYKNPSRRSGPPLDEDDVRNAECDVTSGGPCGRSYLL